MRKEAIIWALLACFQAQGQQIDFCGTVVPIDRPVVKNRLEMAVKKNRREMTNVSLKAKINLYLPYFSIILQQYGLPDDLKFVPLAESRLQRGRESHAGAAGVWQFMPATAAGNGLAPMERNAIIKSTHAACRLLGHLYRQLGSWPLTVAAYNFGIGNILQAMRRQGTTDYYSLRLNAETAGYLYEILSFKILYQQYFEQDSSGLRPDTGRQLPALPVLSAFAGERPESAFGTVIFTSGAVNTPAVSLPDSFTVAATVIRNSYTRDGEVLAFNLGTTGGILPQNTVLKGHIYARRANRAYIAIEGIDVAVQLAEYSGEVYAADGLPGIAVSRAGIAEGEKVAIKFVR